MDKREAKLFPPDSSDVEGPRKAIEHARKDLDNAVKALYKVHEHASGFREIGTGKDALLRTIEEAISSLQDEDKFLEEELSRMSEIGKGLDDGFHDPMSSPEFSKKAASTYDRA